MPLSFSPTAGKKLRASDLLELVTAINSLVAPGWTSYTPTWSASSVNPTLSNGTCTGRYRRAANSDLIIARGRLTIGSTTSIGTGTYFISIPVTPNTDSVAEAVGGAYILDSGNTERAATVQFEDNAKVKFVSSSSAVTHAAPQTWAVGDQLRWMIAYQPA